MPNTTSTTETLYRNLPLHSGSPVGDRKSIRILSLCAGKRHDDLSGSLHVASLEANVQYEALSYTWGDSTTEETILLNDCRSLTITDNLANALRRLRRHLKERKLGVDAICINQEDIEERGQQVMIMADIYRNAQMVLVWLGETYVESALDRLLPFVARLSPKVRRRAVRSLQFRVPKIHWLWGMSERLNWIPLARQLKNRFHRLLAIAFANTSPRWYDRVWVVQEWLLARHVIYCFGQFVSMPMTSNYLPTAFLA